MMSWFVSRAGGLMLAAGFACGCSAKPAADPDPVDQASTAITLGDRFAVQSEVYGGPREINIYAPDVPEWGEGYFDDPLPVVYLVDGGIDQDFIHIAGLSQLPLINAERSPAIIVGVKTDDRYGEITPDPIDPRYQSEFPDHGGANEFRRFLRDEVQPFVSAKGYAGRSAIMGESLAGLFVLDVLAQEPDLFDDYIAISPSAWWDDRRLAKSANAALSDTPDGKRLIIAIANEGGTMEQGAREYAAAVDANAAIDLTFLDYSNEESHGTIYHGAARAALNVLHGMPAPDYGEMPWYLTDGANPPAQSADE